MLRRSDTVRGQTVAIASVAALAISMGAGSTAAMASADGNPVAILAILATESPQLVQSAKLKLARSEPARRRSGNHVARNNAFHRSTIAYSAAQSTCSNGGVE